ncbi:MAG TPA: YtxH domain-containing protein [Terriglobales bacterium]|jgi:gas vesicle protein|nr:YtxH domain-containing protein [Terriglobales bacterium]
MSDNRTNNIGWFLAGLGLGSAVAILFGPKSGRDTRKAMVTAVDDGREYLASLGRDARQQVSDWVDSEKKIFADTRRQVNAAVDAGREAIDEATVEKRS